MHFHSLFQVIQKAKERYPKFSTRMDEAEALGRWEMAVGELIAKHAKAVRVYQSILWVEVEHPIWRSELHYRKQQILDILNGKVASPNQPLPPPKSVLKDILYLEPSSGFKAASRNGIPRKPIDPR